ncbi:hypothetical protein DL93DRAFT_2230138 [Clavulina sp. PMI_390]|nr:hypothetical protein DL93DRAFT_2230138 [Clavulina sp. PMI_390]
MILKAFVFALASCAGFAVIAAPTAASESQVYTPYGLRPAANVRLVPDGASVHHVGNDVHILDAKGTTIDKITPTGNLTKATRTSAAGALQTGWIAYAYWMNSVNSPINYFDTTWVVPPAPQRTTDGQLLFLFNSIETSTGDSILQPVLQWGVSAAGGGPYWSIATWFGIGGHFLHSNLVTVKPGQVLQGIISLTGIGNVGYNYICYFNGLGYRMSVTGSKQLMWATETFEVYNIQSKSDFPLGSTMFSNIHLRTIAGYPSVFWWTDSSTQDDVEALVSRQGSNGGAIQIVYQY